MVLRNSASTAGWSCKAERRTVVWSSIWRRMVVSCSLATDGLTPSNALSKNCAISRLWLAAVSARNSRFLRSQSQTFLNPGLPGADDGAGDQQHE